MKTATIRQTVGLGLLGAALVAASACSDTVREGRSPAYLIIQALEAAPGAEDDEFSNTLESDVVTAGSVIEDPGRVTLRLGLRDIGPVGSSAAPTTNNFITVNRYSVTFRRTDGRNQQGVDVPYSFEGASTVTVGAADVGLTFVLVRPQAKLEPPLRNLRGGGQSVLISTVADVTFYGRDQAGNDVSVTGSISVNFADWADPEEGGSE